MLSKRSWLRQRTAEAFVQLPASRGRKRGFCLGSKAGTGLILGAAALRSAAESPDQSPDVRVGWHAIDSEF